MSRRCHRSGPVGADGAGTIGAPVGVATPRTPPRAAAPGAGGRRTHAELVEVRAQRVAGDAEQGRRAGDIAACLLEHLLDVRAHDLVEGPGRGRRHRRRRRRGRDVEIQHGGVDPRLV
jgi:hypothetical protein